MIAVEIETGIGKVIDTETEIGVEIETETETEIEIEKEIETKMNGDQRSIRVLRRNRSERRDQDQED